MPKQVFYLILLFALFLLPEQGNAQYDSLSPRITLDDTGTVDFDTLVEGDTAYYTFWYTNTGKKELRIKQVWPSCGCTMPKYSPEVVPPGGRGRIDVEFRSKGFKGPIEKYVIVLSNGPEIQPEFKTYILTKEEQAATGFVRKKDRVKPAKSKAKKPRRKSR